MLFEDLLTCFKTLFVLLRLVIPLRQVREGVGFACTRICRNVACSFGASVSFDFGGITSAASIKGNGRYAAQDRISSALAAGCLPVDGERIACEKTDPVTVEI